MKKIYYLLLIMPSALFSQIGIKTTTPLEEVHVAGSTSTIRVEGLNATNNSANLGAGNTTRVFVDGDGDLVLGAATNNIEVLFNPFNYLADPQTTGGANANVVNQTGTGSGYTTAGWPRQSGAGLDTFTLTRNAIVEINYSISWEIEKSGNPVDDQHARVVQTLMYLRRGGPSGPIVTNDLDGVPLTIGFALGLNGQFYTSGSTAGANKQGFNTGTDYIKLGPGTYCPMFAAQLAVGNTGGTGAVKMFLGGGQDEVQLIAHYYN
ncbi:MAG TPA: hypothetical protein VLB74_01440 [Flavobacterium sp.]|uniref:hypothetical protein n=1 Tax=Flavobacterium sp. TaxID=239 RepID=UPI002C96EDA5|nr:hypothetical protein [Flavobacterium sp.]HSD13290.1 hypothetical protein [Flavobacterium sp.]